MEPALWKKRPTGYQPLSGRMEHQVHMVAADARTAVTFCLSPGQAHDAHEGRRLLHSLGPAKCPIHLPMDRAKEGNKIGD